MRGTFRVKNYEQFQHYKTRTPPWIKLYNSLLDDYEFCRLPDGAKWHLIAIFLLASRYDNQIPADEKWVAAKIGATIPVNLPQLEAAGFIEIDQGCSKMLASRKQLDLLEGEREGESETEVEEDSGAKPRGGSALVVTAPIIISIPTNRFDTQQEQVGYHQGKLDEWAATYPAVDVPKAMAAIRQWSIDNPTQRKTVKGMNRFINSWLAREQNRGGNRNERNHNPAHGDARNSRFLSGLGLAIAPPTDGPSEV